MKRRRRKKRRWWWRKKMYSEGRTCRHPAASATAVEVVRRASVSSQASIVETVCPIKPGGVETSHNQMMNKLLPFRLQQLSTLLFSIPNRMVFPLWEYILLTLVIVKQQ